MAMAMRKAQWADYRDGEERPRRDKAGTGISIEEQHQCASKIQARLILRALL
jgi:hypothetical protein